MLLPFFSMVDRRKSLHHDIIAATREQFPMLLVTEVPYSSEIERMSLRRAPLPAFAPRSAAAQIYSALWAELTGALRLAGDSSCGKSQVLPESILDMNRIPRRQ
jgi:chromosome partitioning protein